MIAQALAFADANFPIIPVRVYRDGERWRKQPMVGWDLATTKEITIRSWWSDWPDALPAIPLKKTNLCAVDADKREGVDGVAAVTGLGPLGPHSRIATPSGGLHLVFAQPPEPITKLDWCEGVEVLGTSCLLTCYDLDELRFPFVAPRAVLPEMFRKPRVERRAVVRNLINKGGQETRYIPQGHVLAADLTAALRKMDVRDWRGEHDDWFALMAACAYYGIARDDFVAWSISDPHYASDGALIRRKWRTLKPKHGGALMAALKARGIKVKRAGGGLIDEVPLKARVRDWRSRFDGIRDWLRDHPGEQNLFNASCFVAEIAPHTANVKALLLQVCAANGLTKLLGVEGCRKTIERGFARIEGKG
jgi:hypothetical protein